MKLCIVFLALCLAVTVFATRDEQLVQTEVDQPGDAKAEADPRLCTGVCVHDTYCNLIGGPSCFCFGAICVHTKDVKPDEQIAQAPCH